MIVDPAGGRLPQDQAWVFAYSDLGCTCEPVECPPAPMPTPRALRTWSPGCLTRDCGLTHPVTHPGCRRGLSAAHSSATRPSRPGGDKELHSAVAEWGLGTGLRVEPTWERQEEAAGSHIGPSHPLPRAPSTSPCTEKYGWCQPSRHWLAPPQPRQPSSLL